MTHNPFLTFLGHVMNPTLHAWFSKRSRWMFAAVWVHSEHRHIWRWVDANVYYSGQSNQSIA